MARPRLLPDNFTLALLGTLALLPLNGNCASVVLTLPPEQMAEVMSLDAAAFAREIERRFERRLGAMQLLGAMERLCADAGELADLRAVGKTRVAHDHVEMTERLYRVVDQARRGAGNGKVAFEDQRLRAGARHKSGDPLEAGSVAARMQGERFVELPTPWRKRRQMKKTPF